MIKTKLHAQKGPYCPEIIESFATKDEINFDEESIIICKFLIMSVCSKTVEKLCSMLSEAIFYSLDADEECSISPEIILNALHRIAAKKVIIRV